MEIIGSCGIVCSQCPAYIVHQTGDEKLRNDTAKQWSEMYGSEIPAAVIDCTGCRDEGAKIGYCQECAVRLCAIEKDVANCSLCPEYSCETLDNFLQHVPDARKKLEELRTTL